MKIVFLGMLILINIQEVISQNDYIENRILGDSFKISIPNTFSKMSEEEIRIKYPNNNVGEAYSNEDGTVSLIATIIQESVPEEELENFVSIFSENLQGSLGSYGSTFENLGVKNINGQNIGLMEFINPSLDGDIQNAMALSIFDGRLVLYSFNYLISKEVWTKYRVREIIYSFKKV